MPKIVFSFQLSGVTSASLNNQTVKTKIVSNFAAAFHVAASQVNVTVVTSSSRRVLNTESVTLVVTITNLNAQQAATVNEVISSSTAATQLQTVLVNSSPALAAATVSSLKVIVAGPTFLPTRKPTVIATAKPGQSNLLRSSASDHAGRNAIFFLQGVVAVVLTYFG